MKILAVEMKSFSIFVHFTLVLGVLYSNFGAISSQGEPVPLSYFCMDLTYGDEYNNEFNEKEKAPILLIHGLYGYKETWADFTHLFASKTGRKLCAVDLRNHGASPWSDEYDIPTMAGDVNLFLQTLNFEKIVLLGHSLGGKVAVQFALTYPEKIEKLIIEDMRPNGIADGVPEALKAVRVFENFPDIIPKGSTEKEAKEKIFEVTRDFYGSGDDNERFYFPIACSDGDCNIQSNMAVIEKIRLETAIDLNGSTGVCDKPTLFIYGEESPFKVKEVEEEIMQLFPNAKLLGVKGAGHNLQTFFEFKEGVINFINEEE